MNFVNKHKTGLIIGGIVLAFILLVVGMFASTNNKAVFLEEQINGAQANINVAEKRREHLEGSCCGTSQCPERQY